MLGTLADEAGAPLKVRSSAWEAGALPRRYGNNRHKNLRFRGGQLARFQEPISGLNGAESTDRVKFNRRMAPLRFTTEC